MDIPGRNLVFESESRRGSYLSCDFPLIASSSYLLSALTDVRPDVFLLLPMIIFPGLFMVTLEAAQG